LQAAYGSFVEASWLKQEEKRKSILSQGVQTIASSLLSEDERRKQALDNRLAMLQQAQTDGLITEKRGLELRNQLHADYDQQLADQKTQAMMDAEQNANDLKAQFAQVASTNQLANLGSLASNLSQHLGLITQKNKKTGEDEVSFTKATGKNKLAFVSSTLTAMSGLMSSHNRKAFELGKVAAIGAATIDGISGVQKALGSAPPPFNFALAAIVGVAAAANVAKIASTSFGGKTASANGAVPSVTGGASNVVALNPLTGTPQQARFNAASPQQPTTPVIQITQHITAPNAQIGAADAIQTAANLGAQQALAAVGQDFANNGALRQQLAV